MSRPITITNKSRKVSAVSLRDKPKIAQDITWRVDGEKDQIIILHSPKLALPQILNPTAAKIFSSCNGENTVKGIALGLCEEFEKDDFSKVLADVKKCLKYFSKNQIIQI